jgi:hypothetical protein
MVENSYHRASIEEKKFQQKSFPVQDSTFCSHEKTCKATYLEFTKHSQAQQTLEERLLKDRSSLTPESESFVEYLPIRHGPVKSSFLHLIFSFSSELG